MIGDETGLASQLILIHPFISHPVHEMLYYTTGVYAALLVTNQYWLWGLLRPTRIWTVKELWDGAYGFSSLSEKTKKD